MGKYGTAAIRALELLETSISKDPLQAWEAACRQIFPSSASSQKKGCPKGAFLGLCEAGAIKNVSSGQYTKSLKNKAYALDALAILKSATNVSDADDLWDMIPKDDPAKKHNQQMDVVLTLFSNGLTK